MKKWISRTSALLASILATIPLTGCWDSTEIDQLAIVTATGVDLILHQSTHPTYNITLQIARPSQLGTSQSGGSGAGTGQKDTFINMKHEGTDPMIGIEHIRLETARKIIMSHRRAVILGEPYAKYGIAAMLDEIVRNPNLRMNAFLLVSYHGQASEIVKLPYALNRLPSDAFENLRKEGLVDRSTAKNFIQELSGKGDPWLPGIEPIRTAESPEKNTFNLEHIAIFRKDKLVGWLEETDVKGFNWLVDNVSSGMLSVEIPPHTGTIDGQIIKSKTIRRIQIVNGKPILNIQINALAEIVTTGTNFNFRVPKNIHMAEHAFEANIANITESALRKIQQDYHADAIGAADLIYESHPKIWHQLEPTWRKEFSRMPVQIHVKVRLQNSGTIASSTTNIERW